MSTDKLKKMDEKTHGEDCSQESYVDVGDSVLTSPPPSKYGTDYFYTPQTTGTVDVTSDVANNETILTSTTPVAAPRSRSPPVEPKLSLSKTITHQIDLNTINYGDINDIGSNETVQTTPTSPSADLELAHMGGTPDNCTTPTSSSGKPIKASLLFTPASTQTTFDDDLDDDDDEKSNLDFVNEQLNMLNQESGHLATPIHKSNKQVCQEMAKKIKDAVIKRKDKYRSPVKKFMARLQGRGVKRSPSKIHPVKSKRMRGLTGFLDRGSTKRDESSDADYADDDTSDDDSSSDNNWEIMEESETEIDRQLEENASKCNLTAVNVKNILHQVITNEDVVAMVRNTLMDEVDLTDGAKGALYEPKMTRSKMKEVLEKEGEGHRPWPLTPMKLAKSKGKRFLELELTDEDEEDEEYNPDKEVASLSDEDSESVASSQSHFGSPCPRTPITPRSGISDLERTPSIRGDDSLLSPMGPPPAPSVLLSAQKQSLGQRFQDAMAEHDRRQEEETIALRTRSKFSLTDTSLTELEQNFMAPDFTPDLYDTKCDDNDWQSFLQSLVVPTESEDTNDVNDDETNDPEYNYLEDAKDEEKNVDKEEVRCDRAVRVSKKEMNELMDELFEAYEDIDTMEESEKEVMKIRARNTLMTSHLKKKSQMTPTTFLPCMKVTESERRQIDDQMRKHVQLLSQMYVLGQDNPKQHADIVYHSRFLINELDRFSKSNSSTMGPSSAYKACNLDEAVRLVNDETEGSSDKEEGSKTKKKNRCISPDRSLGYLISKHYLTLSREQKDEIYDVIGVKDGKAITDPCALLQKSNLPNLSDHQKDTIWNSAIFVYPELLPQGKFQSVKETTKNKRVFFTEAEDNLLAIGMDNFKKMPYYRKLIQKFLIPCKSDEQIKIRIKNLAAKKAPDNSVKFYRKAKKLPSFIRYADPFSFSQIKPPRDQSQSNQPTWCKEVKIKEIILSRDKEDGTSCIKRSSSVNIPVPKEDCSDKDEEKSRSAPVTPSQRSQVVDKPQPQMAIRVISHDVDDMDSGLSNMSWPSPTKQHKQIITNRRDSIKQCKSPGFIPLHPGILENETGRKSPITVRIVDRDVIASPSPLVSHIDVNNYDGQDSQESTSKKQFHIPVSPGFCSLPSVVDHASSVITSNIGGVSVSCTTSSSSVTFITNLSSSAAISSESVQTSGLIDAKCINDKASTSAGLINIRTTSENILSSNTNGSVNVSSLTAAPNASSNNMVTTIGSSFSGLLVSANTESSDTLRTSVGNFSELISATGSDTVNTVSKLHSDMRDPVKVSGENVSDIKGKHSCNNVLGEKESMDVVTSSDTFSNFDSITSDNLVPSSGLTSNLTKQTGSLTDTVLTHSDSIKHSLRTTCSSATNSVKRHNSLLHVDAMETSTSSLTDSVMTHTDSFTNQKNEISPDLIKDYMQPATGPNDTLSSCNLSAGRRVTDNPASLYSTSLATGNPVKQISGDTSVNATSSPAVSDPSVAVDMKHLSGKNETIQNAVPSSLANVNQLVSSSGISDNVISKLSTPKQKVLTFTTSPDLLFESSMPFDSFVSMGQDSSVACSTSSEVITTTTCTTSLGTFVSSVCGSNTVTSDSVKSSPVALIHTEGMRTPEKNNLSPYNQSTPESSASYSSLISSPLENTPIKNQRAQETTPTKSTPSPHYRPIAPKLPNTPPFTQLDIPKRLRGKRSSPRKLSLQQQARAICPKGFVIKTYGSPSKKAASNIKNRVLKRGLKILPTPLDMPKKKLHITVKPNMQDKVKISDEVDDDGVLSRNDTASEYDTMESECMSDENLDENTNNNLAKGMLTRSAGKNQLRKSRRKRNSDSCKSMESDDTQSETEEMSQDDSQNEEEALDDENHMADLMAASTTIGFASKKISSKEIKDNRSKAKKRKDATIAMLASNLLRADPHKDDRDTAFAQAYLTKARELLKNDLDCYEKFLKILYDFGKSEMSPVKLYNDLKDLLVKYPDLVNDFSGFLLPEQAVECGCFMTNQEFIRARTLLRKLEIYFDRHPSHFQKVTKMISKWTQKSSKSTKELRNKLEAMLKGQTHLIEELSLFFDDEPPPESYLSDFEEIVLGDSDEDSNMDYDGFEFLELPEDDDESGTKRCQCLCHENSLNQNVRKRNKHCYKCCLKVIDGELYYRVSSKVMKKVKVVYHKPIKAKSVEKNKSPTTQPPPAPETASWEEDDTAAEKENVDITRIEDAPRSRPMNIKLKISNKKKSNSRGRFLTLNEMAESPRKTSHSSITSVTQGSQSRRNQTEIDKNLSSDGQTATSCTNNTPHLRGESSGIVNLNQSFELPSTLCKFQPLVRRTGQRSQTESIPNLYHQPTTICGTQAARSGQSSDKTSECDIKVEKIVSSEQQDTSLGFHSLFSSKDQHDNNMQDKQNIMDKNLETDSLSDRNISYTENEHQNKTVEVVENPMNMDLVLEQTGFSPQKMLNPESNVLKIGNIPLPQDSSCSDILAKAIREANISKGDVSLDSNTSFLGLNLRKNMDCDQIPKDFSVLSAVKESNDNTSELKSSSVNEQLDISMLAYVVETEKGNNSCDNTELSRQSEWRRESDRIILEAVKEHGPGSLTFEYISRTLTNKTPQQISERFHQLLELLTEEETPSEEETEDDKS